MKWTARIFIASALLAAVSFYAATTDLTDGGHRAAEGGIGLGVMASALGLVGSSISFAIIVIRAIVRRIRS